MKPSKRIDRPIVLARTTAELLLDDKSEMARAKMVLRLSPRPRVIIEFDFPRSTHDQATAYNAANQIQTKQYLDIRISPSTNIRTLVGGEWKVGGDDSWCSGMLIPTTQPVTVVNEPAYISRCKFVLINFPSLWGAQDIHRPKSDISGVTVQRMRLHAGPWTIKLKGVDRVMSLDIQMKSLGGSAITHSGSIKRIDGCDFTLEELKVVLDALHLFLSFVRGSYCGLAFLSGQDSQRKTVWKQWGSREVEPWRGPLSSWVSPIESEMLSAVFDGFWQRFTDPVWNDTVSQVLRWYLRSNESGEPAVGIILTQAALERLSHATNGQVSGAKGDQIVSALKEARIDPQIPLHCPELRTLAPHHNWVHGPHAFVDIRNDLVHSEPKLGMVPADAYAEAQHLGQWYIELMLLHLCCYSGRYFNRLEQRAEKGAPIQHVPWADMPSGK